MIREVVERAKLLAISRLRGALPKTACLSGDDLRLAAVSLQRHHKLALGSPTVPELTQEELNRVKLLGANLGIGLATGFTGNGSDRLLEAVAPNKSPGDDNDEDED